MIKKSRNFLVFLTDKQKAEEDAANAANAAKKTESLEAKGEQIREKVTQLEQEIEEAWRQKEASESNSLAESIVSEQEESSSSKVCVITEALQLHDVTPHNCRIAIVDFLYTRVYVENDNTVTRPQIISHLMENYEWSKSTVYRHIAKLERAGFISDLEGQQTIREFQIVGFNARLVKTIRELCETKGWAFGGKLTAG